MFIPMCMTAKEKKEDIMTDKPIPREPENLTCKVCLEEIPSSVSTSQEGDEYTQHFCGIECYSIWKQKQEGSITNKDETA